MSSHVDRACSHHVTWTETQFSKHEGYVESSFDPVRRGSCQNKVGSNSDLILPYMRHKRKYHTRCICNFLKNILGFFSLFFWYNCILQSYGSDFVLKIGKIHSGSTYFQQTINLHYFLVQQHLQLRNNTYFAIRAFFAYSTVICDTNSEVFFSWRRQSLFYPAGVLREYAKSFSAKLLYLCPFAVYYLRYGVRPLFTISRNSFTDGKRAG